MSDLNETLRKKRGRRIGLIVLIVILAALAVCSVLLNRGVIGRSGGTVSISIRCDKLAKDTSVLNNDKLAQQVPGNGVILAEKKVRFKEGETVYDVLARACDDEGILIETAGTGKTSKYVRNIANLYEKAAGEKSGWIYTVNGKTVNVGAAACEVKNGDKILWYYTIDYSTDTP